LRAALFTPSPLHSTFGLQHGAPWLAHAPLLALVAALAGGAHAQVVLQPDLAGAIAAATAENNDPKQEQTNEQDTAEKAIAEQAPVRPTRRAPVAVPQGMKSSEMLRDTLPADVRTQLPTFLRGDNVSGRTELDTVLEGNAELRRVDTVIKADRLEYYQPDDLAKARGNVLVNRRGNVYQGPLLELKVEAFEGFFTQPSYQFLRNNAYGQADRADFIDSKRAILQNATYSTCQRRPGPSWLPDWVLKAASMDLDEENDVGVAKDSRLTFLGMTTPALPSASFPLSDKRKSGWLPPVFGLDSLSGIQLTDSYYWDIAPNRDATFTPTVMSKRGVKLDTEFRYLEPLYKGIAKLDWMPFDSLRQTSRWGASAQHTGLVNTGIPAIGFVVTNVNLNRVSDDNYWRDFPRSSTSLTQRLLPNDMLVAWGRDNLSGSLRTLKWQTLQDVLSPITPPYDRLPQLTARYVRTDVGGFDYSLDFEATKFVAPKNLTFQPNAERLFARGQISYPVQTPGWFVVPKMQWHTSAYQFDEYLSDGSRNARRTVPTFSLDSGVVLERDTDYFGRPFVQTLEPRAFYVYTPYRNQNLIPRYDTGTADFNFATVYTENAFIGNDRISDNNLLTLGVTSRLIDPATGAEAVRLGFAQRLRFKDQLVTLTPYDAPVIDRVSDQLLGLAVNWNNQWVVNSTVQFNQKTDISTRATVGVRYNPGRYRTVSAAYRYQRDVSEQLDIGWQWPLNDLWGDKGQDLGAGRGQGEGRWYSVGRLNYSMRDKKLVDALVGFEYDAGCWLGRIVVDRLQTGASAVGVAAGVTPGASATSISFQLEFVGFSRVGVGTSPQRIFKQNVPRFEYLREPQPTPSHFTQYH
jgi:LPS-assembly protein